MFASFPLQTIPWPSTNPRIQIQLFADPMVGAVALHHPSLQTPAATGFNSEQLRRPCHRWIRWRGAAPSTLCNLAPSPFSCTIFKSAAGSPGGRDTSAHICSRQRRMPSSLSQVPPASSYWQRMLINTSPIQFLHVRMS